MTSKIGLALGSKHQTSAHPFLVKVVRYHLTHNAMDHTGRGQQAQESSSFWNKHSPLKSSFYSQAEPRKVKTNDTIRAERDELGFFQDLLGHISISDLPLMNSHNFLEKSLSFMYLCIPFTLHKHGKAPHSMRNPSCPSKFLLHSTYGNTYRKSNPSSIRNLSYLSYKISQNSPYIPQHASSSSSQCKKWPSTCFRMLHTFRMYAQAPHGMSNLLFMSYTMTYTFHSMHGEAPLITRKPSCMYCKIPDILKHSACVQKSLSVWGEHHTHAARFLTSSNISLVHRSSSQHEQTIIQMFLKSSYIPHVCRSSS